MTHKKFIKDSIIYTYKVENGRVCTTIKINGIWISNPTLESFYAEGWEDYIEPAPEPKPTPEPHIPTYAELVEQYIREHGYPTYGAELAIINNYTTNPTEYEQSYAQYIQTRADAKIWASEQPHRDE